MLSLHDIQRAFGAAILSGNAAIFEQIVNDGLAAAERIRIYRNSASGVLIAALRLSYPVVDRLVGTAFFDAAAGAFIRGNPPLGAYLAEYGAAFADFLESFPPARTLAYLPDVARFEWALNVAANARDAPALEPAALVAIDSDEQRSIRFVPHPSLTLLRLDYPADVIADAVLARDDAAMASIDLASGPVWLIVHRGPGGVEAQRVTQPEWCVTESLCSETPLDSALATALECDLTKLLADHLVKGRFAGFKLARSEREGAR
jgi:hypothetical protein